MIWTRKQTDKLLGHIVYIFWESKAQGKALYVGKSSRGIRRPLGDTHHRSDLVKTCGALEFIPCKNAKIAGALETRLIRRLMPTYNNNILPVQFGPVVVPKRTNDQERRTKQLMEAWRGILTSPTKESDDE